MGRVLKLYCNNPSLTTVKTFGEFYKIRFNDKFTVNNFFEFNRKTIFDQLSATQLQELAKKKNKKVDDLTSDDITVDITLPCPSHLLIAEKYVDYSLIVKNTNFQASETSVIAFEDENIRAILDERSYMVGGAKRTYPGCRVIGWFKSLWYDKKCNNKNKNGTTNIYDADNDFIDISPYITSINTNVTESGGNFSISLPHIPLFTDELEHTMLPHFIYSNGINVKGAVNKNSINDIVYKDEDGKEYLAARSSLESFDYFDWLIQANDLLFISFDNMEGVSTDNLAGNAFDMIALVDSVAISRNAQGAITVNVSGRDLMKLISDDSSIFFETGVGNGTTNVFNNTETVIQGGDTNALLKMNGEDQAATAAASRQLVTGMINVFACEPNDFSIDFVLKTIISQLANIRVVPDNLFTAWGDKRTKFSALKPKQKG